MSIVGVKLVAIVETPVSDQLVNRLENWKFRSASAFLSGQPNEVFDVVNGLALCFEDSGWFTGPMADIIRGALRSLYALDNP